MATIHRTVLWTTIGWLMAMSVSEAAVTRIEIYRHAPFAGGKEFGKTGSYEILQGVAYFAVDPRHKRNRVIVDLDRAPRNATGQVEFSADVFILAPRDPSRGNGAILYDVNNRGNKLALRFFNDAPGGNDPKSENDAGNGFLFRRGYTIVWCGWIGELLPGGNRMLLKAPIALQDGRPIRGIVRYEMVANAPVASMPLSRRENHGSYRPTKAGLAKATLTWRMREADKRVPIPRAQWRLVEVPVKQPERGVEGTLPHLRLEPAGGFRPGYIYELIAEAEGPIVQGLGFAATRDLISFLRYNGSGSNPLARAGKSPIRYAYGFGVSQSGRFLRHFLWEGFNADEQGRRVFDGLIPHVAGGGLGFFNHRFAQPNRHNGQHEAHLYPADVFPFTYGISTDPFTKRKDGILKRLMDENPQLVPKVFHTQSAAEYWHRAGSLPHTDPLGKRDAEIPACVRIYAFGGTQHGPAAKPSKSATDNLTNPADYRPLLRALLDAMDAWVRDGVEPPASVYPRIAERTLVDWRQEHTGFPALPGVRYPEVIQQPPFAYYGPQFLTKRIITVEPPEVRGHYAVLVPRSDKDGNDLGTLLVPDVAVPLATYTGWNLRPRHIGAEAQLASLAGSYIPFPKTKAERLRTGDPRLSVAERYRGFDDYRRRYEKYVRRLVQQRYLLEEDARRLLQSLKARTSGVFSH